MKPSSIQKRRAYQLGPASSGGRSVRMIQGSSCSAYQTTRRVQRRLALGVLKAVPRPIQAVSGRHKKRWGGQPASTIGAESDVLPVAHTGMPALEAYLLPQFGTGYAPVAEHDDGHIPGNRWGQFLEQFHRGVHPGAFLGGLVDAPGHGDGAATVDDADDDGGDLVPLSAWDLWPGPSGWRATRRGPSGAGARSRE